MVAQVDEQDAAMVANAMDPAREANDQADISLPERAECMLKVAMHEIPKKQLSEGVESGAKGPTRMAGGLPDTIKRGNRS